MLLELLKVLHSIDFLEVLWQEIADQVIEILLHLNRQIVGLVFPFTVHEDIVPNELEFIQDFFNELVLSFVVLSSNVVDISGLFDDVFVVVPSESFVGDRFAEDVGLLVGQESLDDFD